MTLQGSGSMTATDIASEMRSTLPLTFPDARTKFLADSGGAVTLPNSYYGKQAVKLTQSFSGVGGTAPNWTATLQLGADYPGRVNVCAGYIYSTANTNNVIPNSIYVNGGDWKLYGAGSAVTANAAGQHSITGSACCFLVPFIVSGTTAALQISTPGTAVTAIEFTCYSVMGVTGLPYNNSSISAFNFSTSANALGMNFNVPTNGVVWVMGMIPAVIGMSFSAGPTTLWQRQMSNSITRLGMYNRTGPFTPGGWTTTLDSGFSDPFCCCGFSMGW